ncbi:MAG: alpha/beta hydrolase, partial [Candidatus Moraniibacteriota bacterium]
MTGYRKSKRIGLVLFAVALFLVSWKSSSAETDEEYLARMHDEYEYIDEDTTWKKTDDLVFSKPILITNTAILTIESGATVHINGDTLTVNHGSIIAEGTESEPIVFKADGNRRFSISFQNTYINTVSRWRYVEIRGAGKFWQEPCVYQANNSSFFTPTVFAAEMCDNMVPVLTYLGGKLHIENTSFIDTQGMDISVRADFQYDESDPEWDSWEDFLNVINSNLADNQQGKALQSTVYCYGQEISSAQCNRRIYLKNNWYGEKIALNNDEAFFRHAQLHGDYVLEGWRAGSLIADPLLIVPGVMGSSQAINGQLVLDPILHTYDDLVASLERNGYEKGKNLFSFPYDWRQSNAYTAELLASRLSTIRTQTGLTKVDVVAHSMGGLVVRSYIEGNGYHDDIDQLITLGAPHHGSPEAYLRWEGGEGFLDRQSKIVRYHFSVEAKHAGYDDLQKYIQAKVLSVRDLLPDTNYLIDADTGRVRNYPTNYPRNTFLEDLNDSSAVAKLQAVRFTNVVGEVKDDKSTIARFRLEPTITSLLGKWVDGEPENFEDNSTDRGLEYGKGDTTVPTASATDITATDEQSLVAGHGDLPMQAQCLVFKKFTGKTDCDFVNDTAIPNILLFNVYSPVNVQIIAPDGKRMGANFDNPAEPFDEIPGAFYTRYHLDPNDTDPNTENEWVTIPNPEKGKYTVKTQGTGNGDFRVESVNISQGDTANEAEESTVNFIGTTTKDQEQSFALVLNDDKTVTGVAEDTIVPTTTPNITGTQGSNNWYTSDVTVTLTATDNENGSGVDTTQYSLNNGTTWNAYTQPIEVTQEGITKIQYR